MEALLVVGFWMAVAGPIVSILGLALVGVVFLCGSRPF